MKKIILLLVLVMTGCAKKPVQAPVPGSIDTTDAWAYRIIADSSKAIHSVKTWEQCSVQNFPITVDIDGATELCDSKAGPFPMQYKDDLNTAINALNAAASVAKAYHDGGSTDTARLTAAVDQLSSSISVLLSHVGGSR
jgi:hypothetical protein